MHPARKRALLMGCATVAAVCCAASPSTAANPDEPQVVKEVSFQGRNVQFAGTAAGLLSRWFRFGPWQYGVRSRDAKPDDRNPNLYILVPGAQFHSDATPQFDHSAIVNRVSENAAQYDVYWAIVLDPQLTRDLRDERDLLIEAQNVFDPGENFDVSAAPGREALIRNLHVQTVADLDKFRRNGKLPRLIIVRAGFSVHAKVTDPDAPVAATAPGVHDKR